MKKLLAWIEAHGVSLRRREHDAAACERKPHRVIAIVGPDPESNRGLARRLFEIHEGRLVRLLQRTPTPAPVEAARPVGIRTDQPTGDVVFHLPGGRWRKPRRWVFFVPFWEGASGPVEGAWQDQSDSLILCVPFSLIAGNGARSTDLCFQLPAIVGYLRERGRLKRTCLVITDIPEAQGPTHPSQTRLQVPRRAPLAQSLEEMLRDGAGQPGHEMSDPAWREFLERTVGANPVFIETFETIRRAAGTLCPIFFVSESEHGRELAKPLQEWLALRREACSDRIRRSLNVLIAASAVCLLALLMAGPSSTLPSAHAGPAVDTIEALIDQAPAFGLRVKSTREALQTALDDFKGEELIQNGADSAQATVEKSLAALREPAPHARLEMARALRQSLESQVASRVNRAGDPRSLKSWDDHLEQMALLAYVLTLRLQGRELETITGDTATADEVIQQLGQLGRAAAVVDLNRLRARTRVSDFAAAYGQFMASRLQAGDDLPKRFAEFLPCQPQPFAEIEGPITVPDKKQDGQALLRVDRLFKLDGLTAIEQGGRIEVLCPGSRASMAQIQINPGDMLDLEWRVENNPSKPILVKGTHGGVATLTIPPAGWTRQCGDEGVTLHGAILSASEVVRSLRLKGSSAWLRRNWPEPPARLRVRLSWAPATLRAGEVAMLSHTTQADRQRR